MSEELKPCPFCGGAPVASPTRTSYIVECNNAGCKVNPDALATFKHDAIAAWNRRATPSTSPASEAGELPPPVAPKGPFADYSAEEVEAYAKDYARAALASTRTAIEPSDRPAIERAAEFLEHYAAYLQEVKLEDIERHPYIPSIQEAAEELRAIINRTASTNAAAGAAAGGNTCKESAEVDVEAERKLYRADFSQIFGCPPSEQSGEFISSRVEDRWQGWLAKARTQADAGKDAERFRHAIAAEDNAETLYASVMNHAPDGNAIRAEFDAATTKPENT